MTSDGYPDEYSYSPLVGLTRTQQRYADGFVDQIHDFVVEELDDDE